MGTVWRPLGGFVALEENFHTLFSSLRSNKATNVPEATDPQICQAVCAVMKLSFEEEYRHALKELGQ